MQMPGHWDAEIAKRINIAATAVYRGMTVGTLKGLDLSCTPAAGSPGTPSRWPPRPGP